VKSTKFVTACYILSFVAYHGPDMISTQTIARWVNVNASRVRQIVARLVRAGLLASTRGGDGGVVIGRNPAVITLLDVFDAVAEQDMTLFSVENPFSDWKDRCRVHSVLTSMRGELEREFRERLSRTLVTSLYAQPVVPHKTTTAKSTAGRSATSKASSEKAKQSKSPRRAAVASAPARKTATRTNPRTQGAPDHPREKVLSTPAASGARRTRRVVEVTK
jgi:Rrf2 family protein